MIARFVAQRSADQRRLALSLATNAATRLPSVLIVLFFLPRFLAGLGAARFSAMMAALALGTAVASLASGFALLASRRIGEAYARGDREGEADVFATFARLNGRFFAGAGTLVVAAALVRSGGDAELAMVALLPLALTLLNASADAVRLAYNEHYVTAAIQICAQLLVYAVALLVPGVSGHALAAACVFTLPMILASLVNLALLLRTRPHLRRGRAGRIGEVARLGATMGIADAALTAPLALGVVWLDWAGDAAVAAWFATLARLFQMTLTPMLLLLIPVAAFVRLKWHGLAPARRQAATCAAVAFALVYGMAAGLGLLLLSRLYVGEVMKLAEPASGAARAAILLLLAAIAAQRAYATIAYLVLDAAHLARWTIVAVAVAAGIAAAAAPFVAPLSAYALFAGAAAAPLVAVLLWNARRAAPLG